MYLKELFDELVKRLQNAKQKDLRPEIIRVQGEPEYNIRIPGGKSIFEVVLKEYRNGITISTNSSEKAIQQVMMPDATLQDALRVVQSAIIIVYGKSLH
ncbi:MAG TPA: hypothetical protein VK463_20715 [Desulfomonilaceae bacterium]|nr:hypothetical protein [Desulfomonilaceae bacterium]